MARINIEDSLFGDPKFMRFARTVGDEAKAIGLLVIAFRLAQKFWCPDRKPIPIEEWEYAELPESIIDCGLAEDKEGGIYVRGSESQFAWYFQKVAAGTKSARIKAAAKENKRLADEQRESTGVERSSTDASRDSTDRNGSQPLTLTPSLTLSQNTELKGPAVADTQRMPTVVEIEEAISIEEKAISRRGNPEIVKAEKNDSDLNSKTAVFIAAYAKAYKNRFGEGRPADIDDGKTRGQIKAFLKSFPLERATDLVQVFFQMETKWFDTKGYDFLTFRNNLNVIGRALESGVQSGGINWAEVNKGAS